MRSLRATRIRLRLEKARPRRRPDPVHGAPNLTIEVATRSIDDRDRGIRDGLSNRFRVEEYWMVNTDAESIEVQARMEGRLAEPRAAGGS